MRSLIGITPLAFAALAFAQLPPPIVRTADSVGLRPITTANLPGLVPPRVTGNRPRQMSVITRPAPEAGAGLARASAADSVALMIAIYSTTFVNGVGTAHAAPMPELVCVRGISPYVDPPVAVLDALRKDRTILIRPMSACRTEPLTASRRQAYTSLVVDTLTGKRGILISATAPEFSDDVKFTFNTGYWQHGLSGGSFKCDGRRERGAWMVTQCWLTLIY